MKKTQWTLSQIATMLQQPQHRLIYLCEQGVIVPDYRDAQGRGSSRKFSALNVFEFSIALILSEFHFPARNSANLLYAIRSFGANVKEVKNDFELPYALIGDTAPEIIGIVTNGSCLHFAIGVVGKPKKVYGGVDISETNRTNNLSFDEHNLTENSSKPQNSRFTPDGSNFARFEINLTQIAQNLMLE